MDNSISSLLDALQDVTEETDLTEWCNKFCQYYETHERHSYSEISQYILSQDGGAEYIYRIVPFLERIRGSLSDNDQETCKKLGKLIDHAKLEVIRLRHIQYLLDTTVMEKYIELNNQQIENFDSLSDDIKSKSEEIQKIYRENMKNKQQIEIEMKNMEEKVGDITAVAKAAEQRVVDAQTDSITILGIFASVVLAFVGGLAFSTSVLQNISNSSIYKLVFVSCGIALVLINSIYILLRFIMEINRGKRDNMKYDIYMKRIDYAISGIAIAIVVAWLIDIHRLAEIIQNIIYR